MKCVITKSLYQARYQPSGDPIYIGPALKLIPGLILGLITDLVFLFSVGLIIVIYP